MTELIFVLASRKLLRFYVGKLETSMKDEGENVSGVIEKFCLHE